MWITDFAMNLYSPICSPKEMVIKVTKSSLYVKSQVLQIYQLSEWLASRTMNTLPNCVFTQMSDGFIWAMWAQTQYITARACMKIRINSHLYFCSWFFFYGQCDNEKWPRYRMVINLREVVGKFGVEFIAPPHIINKQIS